MSKYIVFMEITDKMRPKYKSAEVPNAIVEALKSYFEVTDIAAYPAPKVIKVRKK